jgi:hypothetical protein
MRILNFELFCEARLGDLVNIKGKGDLSDQLKKLKEVEFDLSQKLPKQITLESDQILKVNWHDTATHNLVKRIKERTSFRDIDHFIEYLSKKFTDIFPWMVGKELLNSGKYSIYLKEYKISIIIGFDLKRNMGENYFINILTVLPGRKGENIQRFIDIE